MSCHAGLYRRSGIPLLSLLFGAALSLVACGSPGDTPPDVLIITVDTLRADALSPYSADRSTPRLAELATRSQVFERAMAPMPITRPSHFTLLTGLYPREHGVVTNRNALSPDVPTSAGTLRGHGYQTAGVVGARLLSRRSGLEKSFETLLGPVRRAERSASEVVGQAIEVLKRADPDRALFLWVHVFDPHRPYAPPASHRRGLDPTLAGKMPDATWTALDAVATNRGGEIPQAVLDHARQLYELEAEYTDEQLGRLLDAFDERRGLEQSLVIVTADHGECFEKGIYFEHADCLHDGAMRIPLLIHWPGSLPVGRVAEPVSLVDVAPSVYRAVGIEPERPLSGLPLQDPPPPDRAILLQHPVFANPAHYDYRTRAIRSVAGDPVAPPLVAGRRFGLVSGDWKYLLTEDASGGHQEELYRMGPGGLEETVDVAAEEPQALSVQRKRLAALLASQTPLDQPVGELDPELRSTLEALGYLRSDEPPAGTDSPH